MLKSGGASISEGRALGAAKLKAESRKQKAEIINAEGGDRFQFSKFQLSAFPIDGRRVTPPSEMAVVQYVLPAIFLPWRWFLLSEFQLLVPWFLFDSDALEKLIEINHGLR
jgi:hypothetical protein